MFNAFTVPPEIISVPVDDLLNAVVRLQFIKNGAAVPVTSTVVIVSPTTCVVPAAVGIVNVPLIHGPSLYVGPSAALRNTLAASVGDSVYVPG